MEAIPNAEQIKSAISWLVTTFGAGIAGFVAGKGWATSSQVELVITSPLFLQIATAAVGTILPLLWGLYVHTQKYATAVVDQIPEVAGVITAPTAAGAALAKSVASVTVASAGTAQAAAVAQK